MSFLLDTNVVTEVDRARPDPGVARWISGVPASSLFVSVLVLGEIRRGIEMLRPRDPEVAVLNPFTG